MSREMNVSLISRIARIKQQNQRLEKMTQRFKNISEIRKNLWRKSIATRDALVADKQRLQNEVTSLENQIELIRNAHDAAIEDIARRHQEETRLIHKEYQDQIREYKKKINRYYNELINIEDGIDEELPDEQLKDCEVLGSESSRSVSEEPAESDILFISGQVEEKPDDDYNPLEDKSDEEDDDIISDIINEMKDDEVNIIDNLDIDKDDSEWKEDDECSEDSDVIIMDLIDKSKKDNECEDKEEKECVDKENIEENI